MRFPDWKKILRSQGGSLLMIVGGAVLAVVPDSASMVLSAVVGWIAIAVGVALLVGGFLKGGRRHWILEGAAFLIGGSLLHRHPLALASVVGVVLGIVVLSQGWKTAAAAHRARRMGAAWIPGTVLAAAELLVGLRLLLSPLSISRLVLRIAGIVMLICGICAVAAFFRAEKYIPGKSTIIDADE